MKFRTLNVPPHMSHSDVMRAFNAQPSATVMRARYTPGTKKKVKDPIEGKSKDSPGYWKIDYLADEDINLVAVSKFHRS